METVTVVIDGREEQRPISHIERGDQGRGRMQRSSVVPVLYEGEGCTEDAQGRFHIYRVAEISLNRE